jgi:hypothetical protein
MSYRPQFVYPAIPASDLAEVFTHAFNVGNTPALDGSIPAGGFLNDIPLVLDQNAEFHWAGFKISSDDDGSSLSAQLKDPFGRYLSDGFVPVNLCGVGSGLGGSVGTVPVPVEPAIVCPPGGVVWLYLYNPTAAPYVIDIEVTLFGEKRFRSVRCAA